MSMRYKELLMQAEDAPCTTDRTPLPKDMVVGMAYVPFQQFSQKKTVCRRRRLCAGYHFL